MSNLAAEIKELNKTLAERYQTINDLLEENNELLADLKVQREEADKEINRLLVIIAKNKLAVSE